MNSEDYEELIKPVGDRRTIKRGKAYDHGKRLHLVCATFPVIGKGKIAEFKRSPEKRVLGGEWVLFISEHARPEDHGLLNALRRGVREEVNYKFKEDFYNPKDFLDISYERRDKNFFWSASLFVVPIRSIHQLTPDMEEILDIRERDIDTVFAEARRKNSIYSGFKPESFVKKLEDYTRYSLNHFGKIR